MAEMVRVADERALAARQADDADDDQIVQRHGQHDHRREDGVPARAQVSPCGRNVVRTVSTPRRKPITRLPLSPMKMLAGREVEAEESEQRAEQQRQRRRRRTIARSSRAVMRNAVVATAATPARQAVHVVEEVERVGDGGDPEDGEHDRRGGAEGGERARRSLLNSTSARRDGELHDELRVWSECSAVIDQTDHVQRQACRRESSGRAPSAAARRSVKCSP